MSSTPHPLVGKEILFTRQRHEAQRAGLHWDYRLVLGDKAYSWATRKEMPEAGKAIILFEQPVHDSTYALSKYIKIPVGNYGAGVTTLDWVRKAKVEPETESDKLIFSSDKDKFLLKKLDPIKYGKKAWLFKRLQNEPMTKGAQDNKSNPYLIKIASILYLEKTALNAQTAREMAKKVGVLPSTHSAWKYALRHLRDGRGNPLQGKALNEAKIKLGDVTNNTYQKLKSIDRDIGSRGIEISTRVSGMGKITQPITIGEKYAVRPKYTDNIHTHPVGGSNFYRIAKKKDWTETRDFSTFELAGPSGVHTNAYREGAGKNVGDIINDARKNHLHLKKFQRDLEKKIEKVKASNTSPPINPQKPSLKEKILSLFKRRGINSKNLNKAYTDSINSKNLNKAYTNSINAYNSLRNKLDSDLTKKTNHYVNKYKGPLVSSDMAIAADVGGLHRIAAPSRNVVSAYKMNKSGPRVVYFDHTPRTVKHD